MMSSICSILESVNSQIIGPGIQKSRQWGRRAVVYLQSPQSKNVKIWTARVVGSMIIHPVSKEVFNIFCRIEKCRGDPFMGSLLLSATCAILAVEIAQNNLVREFFMLPIRVPI